MSDLDRSARSPLKAPSLENPLPMARGNSRERTEASPEEKMRGEGPAPEPAPPAPPVVEQPSVADQRNAEMAMMQRPQMQPPPGGSLGDALRNLQKYVQNESFNNQKGQTQEFGPLQFDTKGVEFGPWIRRFVSQVRRNWFVPMAAMSMRGRVVITFYVHRNGALTDVTVIRPSEIESFNTAAVNALLASNPTTPLPPEYPDDKAFFTVTFYYNESPAGSSASPLIAILGPTATGKSALGHRHRRALQRRDHQLRLDRGVSRLRHRHRQGADRTSGAAFRIT